MRPWWTAVPCRAVQACLTTSLTNRSTYWSPGECSYKRQTHRLSRCVHTSRVMSGIRRDEGAGSTTIPSLWSRPHYTARQLAAAPRLGSCPIPCFWCPWKSVMVYGDALSECGFPVVLSCRQLSATALFHSLTSALPIWALEHHTSPERKVPDTLI
jgi:hypothetical protein